MTSRKPPPYIVLRPRPDGSVRPRFSPGPSLRAQGFRGKDLRHNDGRWFTAEEAAHWAMSGRVYPESFSNGVIKTIRKRRLRKKTDSAEWVYFLIAGDWVKIGYSREPLRRTYDVGEALPIETTMVIALRGSVTAERGLHRVLSFYKSRGEWFQFASPIREIIIRSVAAGRLLVDEKRDRVATLVANDPQTRRTPPSVDVYGISRDG